MAEGLSGNNNNSSLETAESRISHLIDSGDSIDSAFLKSALEKKEITESQYVALASKLLEKSEWVEEWLANAGKELGAQVEKLEIDPLTKLLGRALLEPKLNDLIKELNFDDGHHRKSGINAIMVIALDMNGLKFFNDNYNHTVGDQALIILAERLRKVTRRSDLLFRPGGDEFTILLPIENDKPNFKEIFEKIKRDINTGLSIVTENDGKNFPITTSMGYSVLKKGDFKEARKLLDEADENEREDNKKQDKINLLNYIKN